MPTAPAAAVDATEKPKPKIALLFSGQGAQAVGMGQDLCAASPAAAATFERANAVLGRPFTRLVFNGPIEELTRTANCQPALFVHGLAALAALREQAGEFPVQAAAGLSLGEFTAHAAAGPVDFETGLRLVETLGEFVEFVRTARDRGIRRATLLNVAGAYHSQLMEPAYLRLAEELLRTILKNPLFPVVSNVDALPVGANDFDGLRRQLTEQVTGTVRWTGCIEHLVDALGCNLFLELGPGETLAGLVRRIRKDVEVISVGDAEGLARAVERLRLALV